MTGTATFVITSVLGLRHAFAFNIRLRSPYPEEFTIVTDQLRYAPASQKARRLFWPLLALLLANLCLASGPVMVRLASVQAGIGPIGAAFWRMALALPLLMVLTALFGRPAVHCGVRGRIIMLTAGVIFAADLASWHLGIGQTRLANASLFGNAASLLFPAWGFLAWRIRPTGVQAAGFVLAIVGAVTLVGRSVEFDRSHLVGDILCLLAGALYTVYLIVLSGVRATASPWLTLLFTTLAAAPLLLAMALGSGETIWPSHWGAVVSLAILAQVIGQALLIVVLGKVEAVLVGAALLIQPVVGAGIGWIGFGERLTPIDLLGMAMISVSIILIASQAPARPIKE